MTKYQKYAEYRNTESQWIDQIPSHWSMSALKHVLATPMTDGPHETPVFVDEGIPFVSAEAVSSGKIDFNKIRGFITVEDDRRFSQKYKPKLHDVYMIKSGATTGVTAIVETDQNFNIWSPLAAMRCKESFEPYYLLNYLRSDPFQKSVQLSWTFGTQQNIGMSTLENLPVCIPPLMEQRKISSFLTYETAKIDTLIAKQEKLIELLKEKRQSVISHAVTKGLNPDVAMKDSGVEWLGQVPEHWSVSLAKYQCKEITDGAHISPELENGEHYFVSIRDIKEGVINFEDALLTSDKSYQYLVHTGCKPFAGDILFSKDGTIGQTAITPFNTDFVVASSLIIIRPKYSKVTSEFLDLLLRSDVVQEQVESFVKGAALRRLSIQNLLKIWGVFPPLDEQKKIVDFVQFQLDKYKVLELKAEKQVELLKERRTALISSAVTGKIDVRNWQHRNEAKTELSP